MDQTAESASERAYQLIRDGILEGAHRPGTMLGEASLARNLQMSRTPVRVALTRLQQEGWIVIYPKRGALVQGLDDRAIAELADARFVLETTAVERATDDLRRRLADRLDESIATQRRLLADEDLRGFIDLIRQFHRGFVESAGSAILLELYDRLADRHRFLLFASAKQFLAHGEEIIAEHVELTEHLRNGDVAEFTRLLRGHISEVPPDPDDRFTGLPDSVTTTARNSMPQGKRTTRRRPG